MARGISVTESVVKRIGVLTSGGDAPGMNAAIRGVVRTAQCLGIDCIGVKHGYEGLIRGNFVKLDQAAVKGITGRGGTMLYTARSTEYTTDEGAQKAADTIRHMGIDGMVVIGGDGTFQGSMRLIKRGINVVGIPCTIDNDIGCTSYTIGYDTACNTAVDAVDKLNDTMQSHERCSVVEVMGRNAGHLALSVGIATGAMAVNGAKAGDNNPNSTNHTYEAFNKSPIFLDYAYLQWEPVNDLFLTGGKVI